MADGLLIGAELRRTIDVYKRQVGTERLVTEPLIPARRGDDAETAGEKGPALRQGTQRLLCTEGGLKGTALTVVCLLYTSRCV